MWASHEIDLPLRAAVAARCGREKYDDGGAAATAATAAAAGETAQLSGHISLTRLAVAGAGSAGRAACCAAMRAPQGGAGSTCTCAWQCPPGDWGHCRCHCCHWCHCGWQCGVGSTKACTAKEAAGFRRFWLDGSISHEAGAAVCPVSVQSCDQGSQPPAGWRHGFPQQSTQHGSQKLKCLPSQMYGDLFRVWPSISPRHGQG